MSEADDVHREEAHRVARRASLLRVEDTLREEAHTNAVNNEDKIRAEAAASAVAASEKVFTLCVSFTLPSLPSLFPCPMQIWNSL
jgi:hypothetical protein